MGNVPEAFPLRGYTKLPPGGPEYILLSRHERPPK
jgi:hypothetical protein